MSQMILTLHSKILCTENIYPIAKHSGSKKITDVKTKYFTNYYIFSIVFILLQFFIEILQALSGTVVYLQPPYFQLHSNKRKIGTYD